MKALIVLVLLFSSFSYASGYTRFSPSFFVSVEDNPFWGSMQNRDPYERENFSSFPNAFRFVKLRENQYSISFRIMDLGTFKTMGLESSGQFSWTYNEHKYATFTAPKNSDNVIGHSDEYYMQGTFRELKVHSKLYDSNRTVNSYWKTSSTCVHDKGCPIVFTLDRSEAMAAPLGFGQSLKVEVLYAVAGKRLHYIYSDSTKWQMRGSGSKEPTPWEHTIDGFSNMFTFVPNKLDSFNWHTATKKGWKKCFLIENEYDRVYCSYNPDVSPDPSEERAWEFTAVPIRMHTEAPNAGIVEVAIKSNLNNKFLSEDTRCTYEKRVCIKADRTSKNDPLTLRFMMNGVHPNTTDWEAQLGGVLRRRKVKYYDWFK